MTEPTLEARIAKIQDRVDALLDCDADDVTFLLERLAAQEAEIATLRQERDTLMPEYNSIVALLEMERDRSEAAEAEHARLRAAITQTVARWRWLAAVVRAEPASEDVPTLRAFWGCHDGLADELDAVLAPGAETGQTGPVSHRPTPEGG